MEPPFMEEFDDVEEMDEFEDEEEANRNQFMLLVLALGAVLVVAVIAFLFVMLSRNGEKSDIELTNEVVLATNQAIEQAIVATETAEVVRMTSDAVAAAETKAAQETAMVVSATADAATAAAIAAAQPTSTNTSTPTPVVASPTKSPTPEDGTAEADAIAQLTGTPSATKGVGKTPDTGIGGLGVVLVGAVLIVVVFAARRLRMAT